MTSVLNTMKVGLLALVLTMAAFAAVALATTYEAGAQSPPTPPARFTGIVTVDGEVVGSGAVVTAQIEGVNCGSAETDANGRYVVDVQAFIPGEEDCGTDGATVSFLVDGQPAQETGEWINYQLNELDLTVVTQVETPTPTATEPPVETPTETETPDGTPTETETPETPTPVPPETGSAGLGTDGGSSASLLAAMIGIAALAAGSAGALAVRRRSR